MTREELTARLTKAQEAVEKKVATLAKHVAKEQKIRLEIAAKGWDVNLGAYQKRETEEHEDCYWTFCKLEQAQEDIERTEQVIAEKRAVVEKWQGKLNELTETEKKDKEMPELLKQYKESLVKSFNEDDKNRRAFYNEKMKELGYRAFCRKYSGTAYMLAKATDEEINKDNTRTAEALIRNLWNRVKEICKEVTEINLFLENANEWERICINGTVKGTAGTARVQSVEAGGYNIQKLHIRTLVHEVK